MTEPADTIAVRSRPVMLECNVHHESVTPEIKWVRDQVDMTLDNRRWVTYHFCIMLKTIRKKVLQAEKKLHNWEYKIESDVR